MPQAQGRGGRGPALRLVISYAVLATLWIVSSDAGLAHLNLNPANLARAESLKGVGFVVLTAALLYGLIQRLLLRATASHRREIQAINDATTSQRLLTEIARSVSDVIVAKDLDGRFIFLNQAAERDAGRAPGELVGKGLRDVFPEDQARKLEADDARILETREVFRVEETLTIAGQSKTLLTVKGPLLDANGAIFGTFAVVHDITERKRAEDELKIAAAVFESHYGVVVTGPDTVIQRVNPAFTRITGYPAEEAVGSTPQMLHSGRQDKAFYVAMWRALARDGYWQGELLNRRRDGELFTERLTISAVKDASGAVVRYVGTLSDITREKDASERAERLSHYDALTGLPNRILLHDRLAHALQAAKRERQYGALLLLDLDHFRNVNDSLGHTVGDRLLVQAAQRMRQAIREHDTLARFSGDKFAIVLEGLGRESGPAAAHAAAIGEKLVVAMGQPLQAADRRIACTVSIGLTTFRGSPDNVDVLLKQAELAMYRAKRDGRNTLRLFEQEMQDALDARNALEADLHRAVAARQFVLHYQPQVDRAHRLIGAEALVRWNHPVHGLVGPAAFISVAEETGLIEPLGQFVLEEACRQLGLWAHDAATREITLAVNVSARQFRQPEFVGSVLRVVAAAGIDPTRLKLEITESLTLENMDDTVAKLGALRARGITISVDDFGTGSSSLAYLARLPLDQIKIDKSFVDKLPGTRNDGLIVQAILAMGKGMGLHVIAEGVETRAQLGFLASHGCDAYQGYLFGKPLPVDEFDALAAAMAGASADLWPG